MWWFAQNTTCTACLLSMASLAIWKRMTWKNSRNNGLSCLTTCWWHVCFYKNLNLFHSPCVLEYKMRLWIGFRIKTFQELPWFQCTGDIFLFCRVLIPGRFPQLYFYICILYQQRKSFLEFEIKCIERLVRIVWKKGKWRKNDILSPQLKDSLFSWSGESGHHQLGTGQHFPGLSPWRIEIVHFSLPQDLLV